MLDFEAQERFTSYLSESMSQSIDDDIKDVAETANRILSFRFARAATDPKNLIFLQKQMLEVAAEHLEEKPWITYFAALKHIVFLRARGIDAAAFDDFRDKESTSSGKAGRRSC